MKATNSKSRKSGSKGLTESIAAATSEPTYAGMNVSETAHFVHEFLRENSPEIAEAFTQADIELALDDRGWMIGGKRMAGELDPLSRQVAVNRARYYRMKDPLAKQAVRLWTDYTFGSEAVTWSCDDTGVQSKLDKFMKNRRNRRITSRAGLRKMSHRLLTDGEIFFAVYSDGVIRAFDCLQITDIITDPDDTDTIIAYKRVTTNPDNTQQTRYYEPWDYDEASDVPLIDPVGKKKFKFEDDVIVYHLAFDSFDKRGESLLGSCSEWSREHRRFMVARVALTQALSKFAYKGTVKGGQKVIDGIRSKLESTFAQTGLSGGTEHQPATAPGGTWFQNEGINLEAMPRGTGATDAKSDADGLKLMVCAGTGIMLHYFGDPSTGNLATATAMELPMLKMFGAYQQLWKDAWRDIFAVVLEEDLDEEPAEITIEMPAIIEDDLTALGTFLTSVTSAFPEAKVPALLQMALVSAGVQNIDQVMKDIADQKEENDKAAADLLKQGVMTGPGGKPVPANNGTPKSGQSQDATESEQYRLLTEAVNKLAEKL